MCILLIIVLSMCVLLVGAISVNATITTTGQSGNSNYYYQSSSKWEQVKTTTSSHMNQFTKPATSRICWSQVGDTLKSYWQQNVATIKGWFSSNYS